MNPKLYVLAVFMAHEQVGTYVWKTLPLVCEWVKVDMYCKGFWVVERLEQHYINAVHLPVFALIVIDCTWGHICVLYFCSRGDQMFLQAKIIKAIQRENILILT